jgi:hypothetical protein
MDRVLIILGILTMSQLAGADETRDDGSTMIASAKSTNTLGKKPASEISKEAAEKKQAKRDKQKAANRKLMKMKKYHGGLGMNPVEEELLLQLPWEVRKQLKDIPQNRRANWMIERLVERKAPMIAKRLCRNKKFKERYDNASQEEKPELLERGLKIHIQSKMKKSKRGDIRGFEQGRRVYEFHRKMTPEQRKKFTKASPERKREFMADKAMKHKGDEVRKVIVKDPELKKKLEKMSPEDRKATIEKLLKQKMAGDFKKGMKDRQMQRRGEHQPRQKMMQPRRERQPQQRNMQHRGAQEFFKKITPEQRKKFMDASPERKLDFMAEKVMKHKGAEIRKLIEKNPELKKKLEKMSPEDRKAAIKKMLKMKMAGHFKGMKERGDSLRFRQDKRSMMRDRGEMPRMRQGRERMEHPRMMDRHGMGHDRGMMEHPRMERPPMMRDHQGMRDRDGMQKHDQFMRRDFERELPRMMLHFMRENPERVREFIRNLPPEIKRELRNLLDDEPRKFHKKDKKNRKGRKNRKNKKERRN